MSVDHPRRDYICAQGDNQVAIYVEDFHGDGTSIAHRIRREDDCSCDPLVYEDLRRLAHHYVSGQRPDHTLQTTALVNEAYLRLADQTNPNWQDRAHFFAVAARAICQILVNYAKSSRAQKRGGGAHKVELARLFSHLRQLMPV